MPDADGEVRAGGDAAELTGLLDVSKWPTGMRVIVREFDINQTWLMLVQITADLTAWPRLLALTGDAQVLASCKPKALRYRFLHVPTRLVRGQ